MLLCNDDGFYGKCDINLNRSHLNYAMNIYNFNHYFIHNYKCRIFLVFRLFFFSNSVKQLEIVAFRKCIVRKLIYAVIIVKKYLGNTSEKQRS